MMVRRIIREHLEGSTTKEAYEWLRETKVWDSLSQNQQDYLIGNKPWDLNWLTLEWFVEAIGRYNKSLAYLILTSQELQEHIKANILELKQTLGEADA